jgi:predicted XRE-type DNA-binding protein
MVDPQSKTQDSDDAITRGTDNVLADLGFADAGEQQTKLRLALALNRLIKDQGLLQAKAAERLGINQPKVSALCAYQLNGFSVERLMTFLTAMDQDVAITIRNKSPRQPTGKITVDAA